MHDCVGHVATKHFADKAVANFEVADEGLDLLDLFGELVLDFVAVFECELVEELQFFVRAVQLAYPGHKRGEVLGILEKYPRELWLGEELLPNLLVELTGGVAVHRDR